MLIEVKLSFIIKISESASRVEKPLSQTRNDYKQLNCYNLLLLSRTLEMTASYANKTSQKIPWHLIEATGHPRSLLIFTSTSIRILTQQRIAAKWTIEGGTEYASETSAR
ncbi:hypothetical protein TNCV_700951 [Trichonephila clavipes]|nr:hypothetical protein TNCV_700951 [Trichonephila clavipes]